MDIPGNPALVMRSPRGTSLIRRMIRLVVTIQTSQQQKSRSIALSAVRINTKSVHPILIVTVRIITTLPIALGLVHLRLTRLPVS